MDHRQRQDLDNHITGHYGEDQFKGEDDPHIVQIFKVEEDGSETRVGTYGPFANTEDADEWITRIEATGLVAGVVFLIINLDTPESLLEAMKEGSHE